jgi:superfamily II DNA or RNA helicase
VDQSRVPIASVVLERVEARSTDIALPTGVGKTFGAAGLIATREGERRQ